MTLPISQRPPYVLLQLRDTETFKAAVHARKLSVRKLASKADVGTGTIGHLVSGTRSQCLRESAQRIADALDMPLDVLFKQGPPLGRQPRNHSNAA